MSRSRKKNPVLAFTGATSEKQDKRIANRKFRRRIKVSIINGTENPFPLVKEVSDIWCFEKDGKSYVKNPDKEHFRK